MSNIFDIVKIMGDKNTSVLAEGKGSAEYDGFIDTGSYSLNALMSGSIFGGMPDNKTVCIAGPSSTGKTFFALSILDNFMKKNSDGVGVLMETEGSTSRETANSRGIDPNRIILSEPETVEQFRTAAVRLIDYKLEDKKAPPLFFVLDSLGQLSTAKEVGDIAAGKETKDMTRAQLIKGAFRVIRLRIGKARIPFLVINHTYDDMSGQSHAQKISGGSGAIYASDMIFTLTKAKDTDADRVMQGSFITITAYKSRLTREGSKVRVRLNHENGLDRYYGLLEFVDEMDIWPKISVKYETPHGKFYESQIYKDPERFFTQDVLEKIDAHVQKKFKYGNMHTFVKDEGELESEIDSDVELIDEA